MFRTIGVGRFLCFSSLGAEKPPSKKADGPDLSNPLLYPAAVHRDRTGQLPGAVHDVQG